MNRTAPKGAVLSLALFEHANGRIFTSAQKTNVQSVERKFSQRLNPAVAE